MAHQPEVDDPNVPEAPDEASLLDLVNGQADVEDQTAREVERRG